jgi:hypothetical protein
MEYVMLYAVIQGFHQTDSHNCSLFQKQNISVQIMADTSDAPWIYALKLELRKFACGKYIKQHLVFINQFGYLIIYYP